MSGSVQIHIADMRTMSESIRAFSADAPATGGKVNGLDLFSGIGGISLALREWVTPIAYCEIDPYCQAVLLSRMATGDLVHAPIWDDIKTLRIRPQEIDIDIIYGGFPCQDISIAGHGKGLAGERSGLFFEIMRLAEKNKPKFIFLENVPAITSRGGLQVVREITSLGYDCRWCVISAASIGALHRRERWFLLAHSNDKRLQGQRNRVSSAEMEKPKPSRLYEHDVSNSASLRCDKGAGESIYSEWQTIINAQSGNFSSKVFNFWENTEPPVCGVAHGLPFRVDQVRALGNSVVPTQAKKAFKILMGLTK